MQRDDRPQSLITLLRQPKEKARFMQNVRDFMRAMENRSGMSGVSTRLFNEVDGERENGLFARSELYQEGFASLTAYMQNIIPEKRGGFENRIEVHEKTVTGNLCNFVHDCLHFAFNEIIAADGNIKPEITEMMYESVKASAEQTALLTNLLQDNEFKWSLISGYVSLFVNANELVLERLNAIKLKVADKNKQLDFEGLSAQIYLKFVYTVLNEITDLVRVKRMPVDASFDLCLAKLFFSTYSLQKMIATSAKDFYLLEDKAEEPVVTLDADEQQLVAEGMKAFYECLADKEKLEEAVSRSQFLSESKTKLAFSPAYPFYYFTEMLKQPAEARALDLRMKPEKMESEQRKNRYDERALDVMRDFYVLNPEVYRIFMKRPHEFRFALGCIEFFVMDNAKKILDKKYGFDKPEHISKKQLILSKLTDDIISGLTADRVAQAVRRYDSARPMFELFVTEFTKLQQMKMEDEAENQLKESTCEAIRDILSHELSECRSLSAREGCYQRFALMCEQKRLSYLPATEKSLHDQMLAALGALVMVLHLAQPDDARYRNEMKNMVLSVNELYRTIEQMAESGVAENPNDFLEDMLTPYLMSRFSFFLSNPLLLSRLTDLAEHAVLDHYGDEGVACKYHLVMLHAALQRLVRQHLFQVDIHHLSHADVSLNDAIEKFEHHVAVMRTAIQALEESDQAPLAVVLMNELEDDVNQAEVIKEDDSLDDVSKIIAILKLTEHVINIQSEPVGKKQSSSLSGDSMEEIEAGAFVKIMQWREMNLDDIHQDDVKALVTALHEEVLEPSLEYQFMSAIFIDEALGILRDGNYSQASRGERLVDLLRLYSIQNKHVVLNLNGCNFNKIVLNDIDRANMQMRDASLFRCRIDNCSLQDCNMNQARFSDCEIVGSQFQQTNFANATFDGSILRAVTFESCSLSHASFLNVIFEDDVIFENCDLTGGQFIPYDQKLPLNKWMNFFDLAIKLKLSDEMVHENIDKNVNANVASYESDMSKKLKDIYLELKTKKGSELPFFRKYTGVEVKSETKDKTRDNKP